MAQTHKGPRAQIKMMVPDAVLERIHRDQAAHRVGQLSQFVSDVLCLIYDRKELVRELDPQQLEFPALDFHERQTDEAPAAAGRAVGGTSQVKIRVPEDVMEAVKADRERFGISSWAVFIADLLCHAYGCPDLARELNRGGGEEQLELPIRAQPQGAVA